MEGVGVEEDVEALEDCVGAEEAGMAAADEEEEVVWVEEVGTTVAGEEDEGVWATCVSAEADDEVM